jgi:RND family efflux transporter MFP subunit
LIGPRKEAIAEAEAKIAAADKAIATSQARVDLHTLRAPIDGVLDSLNCHPGQTLAIGTSIGDVVDTRQIYAVVWLPTQTAEKIRPAQKAQITPGGADNSRAEEPAVAGEVVAVGRVVDAQTGNLPVRILVDNSRGLLTLGQTVDVAIALDDSPDVLSVPRAAIFDVGEGPVVVVVRGGKAITLRPTLGTTHEGWTAVSGSDLKEGESVVVEGAFNLHDAAAVTISPSAAAPAEDKPGQ